MASYEPYLPVMVDFKKKTQKLRFLVDKTAAQTVSAIMKKLGVKDVHIEIKEIWFMLILIVLKTKNKTKTK